MLYKIMGLTSLKNVFYGRIDFEWGTNLIWPLVCTIKHVTNRYILANTIVRIIIYKFKIYLVSENFKMIGFRYFNLFIVILIRITLNCS